jgi:hypothetical protein
MPVSPSLTRYTVVPCKVTALSTFGLYSNYRPASTTQEYHLLAWAKFWKLNTNSYLCPTFLASREITSGARESPHVLRIGLLRFILSGFGPQQPSRNLYPYHGFSSPIITRATSYTGKRGPRPAHQENHHRVHRHLSRISMSPPVHTDQVSNHGMGRPLYHYSNGMSIDRQVVVCVLRNAP